MPHRLPSPGASACGLLQRQIAAVAALGFSSLSFWRNCKRMCSSYGVWAHCLSKSKPFVFSDLWWHRGQRHLYGAGAILFDPFCRFWREAVRLLVPWWLPKRLPKVSCKQEWSAKMLCIYFLHAWSRMQASFSTFFLPVLSICRFSYLLQFLLLKSNTAPSWIVLIVHWIEHLGVPLVLCCS